SRSFSVADVARVMAQRLRAATDSWLPIPGAYRLLTAALLPARLRDAFELRYGSAEREDAQRLTAWARRIYPFLPARLRHVGPYQEAQQRLPGRAGPDFVTWLSNRFWMGQGALGHWPA